MALSLVELKSVSVVRDGHRSLNDVSLKIDQGESVAILGPNGAGKSTFIKLLNREVYPYGAEGEMTLLGQKRWHVEELRGHLGIVGNELGAKLDPELENLDVILTGFTGHLSLNWRDHLTDSMRSKAIEALERVSAKHLIHRTYGSLSSGEARRIMVARALSHSPQALLLDEPTTSMDIKSRSQFLDLMRRLHSEGLAILLVTHHVEEILPFFERVFGFQNGRLLWSGPREEIMKDGPLSDLFDLPLHLIGTGPYSVSVNPAALKDETELSRSILGGYR